MLGSLGEQIINLTDTLVVGSINKENLGAVGLGSLLYFTFVFIALGLGVGIQIITGRRNGEGNFAEAGRVNTQAIYLYSALAVVLFVALELAAQPILSFMVQDPEVQSLAGEYIRTRQFGLLFICLSIVFRMFYIGITRTLIITVITLILAGVNLLLNRWFVFGGHGLAPMGIGGSALASVIAEGVAMLGYIGFTLFNKKLRPYALFRFSRPDFGAMRQILYTGFPIMLQGWVSVASWFMFFTVIEHINSDALAASTVVKSLYLLTMIPVWALGSATNTLVSNAIGAGLHRAIPFLIRHSLMLSVLIVGCLTLTGYLFPTPLIHFYTDDAGVAAMSRDSFFIALTATLMFSVGSIFFNVISGSGATRITLFIELATLALYVSYILIISRFSWVRMEHIWLAEIIYMGGMAAASIVYVNTGRWKEYKV